MIEKLGKFDSTEASIYHVERLYAKVNEVITELNHILEERESGIKVYEEAQDMYDNAILDALKDKKVDVVVEPADPYAEQKKWIGCICRFWNDESLEDSMYGELVNIADVPHEKCPFQCGYGEWYAYCEPVKPDDDIIYKGEQ